MGRCHRPPRGALLSICSSSSKCWEFGPLTGLKLVFPAGNESPNSPHIVKNASSLQNFYITATVTEQSAKAKTVAEGEIPFNVKPLWGVEREGFRAK